MRLGVSVRVAAPIFLSPGIVAAVVSLYFVFAMGGTRLVVRHTADLVAVWRKTAKRSYQRDVGGGCLLRGKARPLAMSAELGPGLWVGEWVGGSPHLAVRGFVSDRELQREKEGESDAYMQGVSSNGISMRMDIVEESSHTIARTSTTGLHERSRAKDLLESMCLQSLV